MSRSQAPGRHRRLRTIPAGPESTLAPAAPVEIEVVETDAASERAERGRRRDKALVAAAVTTIATRALVALSGIATIAIAAHSLSTPQLGVVAVLTTIVVFLPFADLGFGTIIMTKLPIAHARGDTAGMQYVVQAAVTALTGIAVLFGGIGVATAFLTDWPAALGAQGLSASDTRSSVVAFFIAGGLAIPATIGARVLVAMQRTATVRFVNSTVAVVTIAATAGCAVLDAPMWAYVTAIAGMVTGGALIQTWWVLARAYPELRPTSFLGFRETLAFVRTGTAYALLSLSWLISYCIDLLVVSAILRAEAAAVFSVAVRLFNIVSGTITGAGQQMWSALADAIAREDLAWARSRFRSALMLTLGLGGLVCAVLVVLGQPLARIWVGPHLVPPIPLLVACAGWTLYFTAMSQMTYLLAAVGRVRMLAITGVIMAPVNLTLSIALTKAVGLTGPVLGSIAAVTLVQAVPLIAATRAQLRDHARLEQMTDLQTSVHG